MRKVVPLSSLKADIFDGTQGYQRPLDPRNLKRISHDFDPRRIGTIMVSSADVPGGQDPRFMYTYDGNHRVTVLRNMGYTEYEVQVTDLSRPEQASEYVVMNTGQKRNSKFEVHVARLAAGDAAAVEIEKSLLNYGLRTVPNHRQNGIASIAALEYLQRNGTLDDVLEIYAATFGPIKEIGHNELLNGMGKLLKTYGELMSGYRSGNWKRRLSDKLVDKYGKGMLGVQALKRAQSTLHDASPNTNRASAMATILMRTWDSGLKKDSEFRLEKPIEFDD